ncbi:cation:proton antiporter [Yaniella flava]|uniref:Cation:proton antiporter n=1 Tax=Yaniella flava TaxID=287930 RepID=A0ABN2UN20_9MICC
MSVLELAGWISLFFVAVGVLGALYRIVRGPALLDRAIAVDVVLIALSSGLTVWMALAGQPDYIMIVVVASLIGFISSATLARFTVEGAQANQSEPEPKQGPGGARS